MTMTPTRIYLLRHGQVEGFQDKRYNGQADVQLTAQGLEEYESLRARLADKPLRAIYTSDLSRCHTGAHLLAQTHGLSPVATAKLRELHIGEWEGMTWKEIQERFPKQWQARLDDIVNYRVPGGENLVDLAARVRPMIRRIVSEHTGQEVVVVGHGGVNRVLLLDAIGAPLGRLFHIEQNFGCLNIIDYYPDGIGVVKLLNG